MLSFKLFCFVLASVAICSVSAYGNGEGIRSDDVQSPILRALRVRRSPLPDPHRHKLKGVPVLVQPVGVAVPAQPVYSCNVCGGSGGHHGGYHHKGVVGYGGHGGLGGYGGYGGLGGASFSQSSSQASSFGGFGGSGSHSSAQSSSNSFGR